MAINEDELILKQQKQANNAETEKQILEQDVRDYDNEWITYIASLAKNQSTKDIADFIESVEWTDRQKRTIKNYAKIILGDGLSTAFIDGYRGFQRMKDLKALTDCDLTLGMTTFDITPEFNILRGMIDMHFELALTNSVGGFFVKRIGTKTHEIQHEEKTRPKEQGLKEKITGWQ